MPESYGDALTIREAKWPEDETNATSLLRQYAAYLSSGTRQDAGICLTGYEAELTQLSCLWSRPHGVLLLAFASGVPVGCVAVKVRDERTPAACELKRLWVEDNARGRGVGRTLIQAAAHWSRSHGAAVLLLDTVPSAMPEAVLLYRSVGFRETTRHNSNSVPGLMFMQMDLIAEPQHSQHV